MDNGFEAPSIHRIIWVDWPALFAASGIPIAWLIGFIFPYIRRGAQPRIAVAGALTTICIAVVASRVLRIQRLFRLGTTTQGRITALRLAKDRGRIECAYEVEGRRFESWSPVHKTRAVLSLEVGEVVEILVDKERPLRAVVKRLYSADP
ncbi:MAG TPA: hypothetical protein VE964_04000 [Myxococcales bacterium]|nr:hypothetical protein [Myxococcales bacterium]